MNACMVSEVIQMNLSASKCLSTGKALEIQSLVFGHVWYNVLEGP